MPNKPIPTLTPNAKKKRDYFIFYNAYMPISAIGVSMD